MFEDRLELLAERPVLRGGARCEVETFPSEAEVIVEALQLPWTRVHRADLRDGALRGVDLRHVQIAATDGTGQLRGALFGAFQFADGAFQVLDLALLGGERRGAGEGRQLIHRLAQGAAERQNCAHGIWSPMQ